MNGSYQQIDTEGNSSDIGSNETNLGLPLLDFGQKAISVILDTHLHLELEWA